MLQSRNTLIITTRFISRAERPSKIVDKFIRVDHAGELGADRIYAGQMAVLGELRESLTFISNYSKIMILE